MTDAEFSEQKEEIQHWLRKQKRLGEIWKQIEDKNNGKDISISDLNSDNDLGLGEIKGLERGNV